MSMNLERMLKAAGQTVPAAKPILEINPRHPIVRRLGSASAQAQFSDWSHILFDQAMLAEGGELEDPAGFVKRLNDLLLRPPVRVLHTRQRLFVHAPLTRQRLYSGA
jgi:molecular chaperone HtpG